MIVGQKLDKFDVVITTYQTLASEHAKDKADSDSDNSKQGGALFERKWLRIVLGKFGWELGSRQTKHITSRIETPRQPRQQSLSEQSTGGV